MLIKILGIIWVILGILWVAKPQILRNRIKKKMLRKIKWIVFGFVLVFGLSIIGSIIKAQGLFLKVIGVIALIVIIKSLLLVTSKTSEKMLGWLQESPLQLFRLWGFFIFAMGVMLVFV